MVKNLSMQEIHVRSLDHKDALEEGMTTPCSLVDCGLRGLKELDMMEVTEHASKIYLKKKKKNYFSKFQ